MEKPFYKKAGIVALIAAGVVIKILIIIGITAAALFGAGAVIGLLCGDIESTETHIIKTLPEYSDYDMWCFGFQDLTVYGMYYFDKPISETELENSGYFKKVTDENLTDIINAVVDYEQDVEATKGNGGTFGDDISEVYDFDKSQLDSDGWWYYFETTVDAEEYEPFEPDEAEQYYNTSFNYYFYSEDARIVYIMHNNT